MLGPYPAAVDDHQTRNAQYLVERGAALLAPESQLSAQKLADLLRELLGDRARLLRMAQAARGAAWLRAEKQIADAVLAEGAHG